MSTMNHDEVVSLMTHALADRRAHEDPWYELAMGTLTRAQLISMRSSLESADALEHKLALFEPPTATVREQTLQALLRRHASPDGTTLGDAAADRGGNVVPLARARRSWKTTTLLGAFLVAASALLFASLRPSGDGELADGRAQLPGFELQLQGGWSGDLRGAQTHGPPADAEGCDERYQRGQSVSLRLHPSEPIGDALSVAVHAQGRTGEGHWIPSAALEPKLSAEGVLAIEQPVVDLGLSVGTWTLTFYVVRDGEPLDPAWLRGLGPGAHPGVTVVAGTVCVVE